MQASPGVDPPIQMHSSIQARELRILTNIIDNCRLRSRDGLILCMATRERTKSSSSIAMLIERPKLLDKIRINRKEDLIQKMRRDQKSRKYIKLRTWPSPPQCSSFRLHNSIL